MVYQGGEEELFMATMPPEFLDMFSYVDSVAGAWKSDWPPEER